MADYSDALLSAALHTLNERMQRPEFRKKPSAALTAFQKSGEFLIPATAREEMYQTKKSDSQTAEIHLLSKRSASTITARAYNHTESNGDSIKETLTFATYGAKFKYSLKQADRSFWALAEQISADIRSAFIAIHAQIEAAAIAKLAADKSQVVKSLSPSGGTWDATNFIFQVANANGKTFLEKVRSFMVQQYLQDDTELIHSPGLNSIVNYVLNQGVGNAENLAWQAAGFSGSYNSVDLSEAGYEGIGYAFPFGSIGVVDWIPSLNRAGNRVDPFAVGGAYGTIADPFGSGLTFALHQYAAGADNQSGAGERQDVNIYGEITCDLAFVVAPESTANQSAVYKVGLLDT